jgi:hypothetical protein
MLAALENHRPAAKFCLRLTASVSVDDDRVHDYLRNKFCKVELKIKTAAPSAAVADFTDKLEPDAVMVCYLFENID